MSTLTVTILLAFLVILIAILALAIGWLITGKSKIERGACGRDPTHKRDEKCGTNIQCDLCEHPEDDKK